MKPPRSISGLGLSASEVFIVFVMTMAYVMSRLYAVSHLPVFSDEALHIQWARESLSHGGGGLFEGRWLTIKLFALLGRLPFDHLLIARLAIMTSGAFAAFACLLTGRLLFSLREGFIAAGVYVILPFTLLYDSLAMADCLAMALGAWLILFSILVVRSTWWVYPSLLAGALIAAILVKLSAAVFILVPLTAVLILSPRAERRAALTRTGPAILTATVLLAFLYQQGFVEAHQWRLNQTLAAVLVQLLTNLHLATSWLWGLLTPSVFLTAILALAWAVARDRSRASLLLVVVLLIAIAPYVVTARIWYPRYLLFSVVPISLLVAHFLYLVEVSVYRRIVASSWQNARHGASVLAIAIAVFFVFWPGKLSLAILRDLSNAALPREEYFQLVAHWPSGYGLPELVAYLREQSVGSPGGVNVVRLNWWDPPYLGLNLYLTPSPLLALYTVDTTGSNIVEEIVQLGNTRRTFLVMSLMGDDPAFLPNAAARILQCSNRTWSYLRPGGQSGLEVREVGRCENPPRGMLSPGTWTHSRRAMPILAARVAPADASRPSPMSGVALPPVED